MTDTQAYKMLGNGWTVDLIAHIMSHFDGITTLPTEIDKYAIKTTLHNYPDTIQLGDAFQVRDSN